MSHLLTGILGIAVGTWLGGALFSPAPEVPIALYKRSTAFRLACEAAGAEIAALRRVSVFIDDCAKPVVTPVLGREGVLIVSRVVEGQADDDDGQRLTYSVKMDGRAIDRWRVIEVKRAPNQVMLDVSLLPTRASSTPRPR